MTAPATRASAADARATPRRGSPVHMRRGSPEWKRRAEAWGRAHGMPAELWLGPDLDPLPEPPPGTQPPGPEISPPGPFQPRAATEPDRPTTGLHGPDFGSSDRAAR